MSNPSGPEDKANGDRAAEQELPTPQQPEDSAAKKQQHRPSKNQHPRKVYDLLLDSWYYAEVNKRMNEHVGLFKNYQINPYTKKTRAPENSFFLEKPNYWALLHFKNYNQSCFCLSWLRDPKDNRAEDTTSTGEAVSDLRPKLHDYGRRAEAPRLVQGPK